MNKKQAFTLTETLIMVAVIGVIAVISMVSLKNMKPDKDVLMIRKAYSDTSKAVAALINDEDLYPMIAYNINDNYKEFLATLSQSQAAVNTYQTEVRCAVDHITGEQYDCVDDLEPVTSSLTVPTSSTSTTSWATSSSSTTSYVVATSWAKPATSLVVATSMAKIQCAYQVWDEPNYFSDGSSYCLNGNAVCGSSYVSDGLEGCEPSSSSGSHIGTSYSLSSRVLLGSYARWDDVSADEIYGPTQGTTGTTNLQDGTYEDKDYIKDGSLQVKDHGTVFLDTTLPTGATAYTSSNKFAYNFGKKFKNEDLSCSGNVCTFSTADGMAWEITDNFNNSSKNALVEVDINGASVGSNISTGNTPDVYTFQVDAGGKVSVYGNDAAATKAKRALKTRKNKV